MKKKVKKSKVIKKVKKAKVVMKFKSGITPLADRVLVKPFTEDELKGGKTGNFGIIIPDTISKEKSAQGKVLAVGPDVKGVKIGDRVVFSKYSYEEVEYGGDSLYLLKEENVFAVIK